MNLNHFVKVYLSITIFQIYFKLHLIQYSFFQVQILPILTLNIINR